MAAHPVKSPPDPWVLHGHAFQAMRLVDLARVAPRVPSGLKVVPVGPGRTLGGAFFARYEAGPMAPYHELIFTPALVRSGTKVGFWVSHLFTDEPELVDASREVWGLPKELARFDWRQGPDGGDVQVHRDGLQVCAYAFRGKGRSARLSLPLATFGTLPGEALFTRARAQASVRRARGRLVVPEDSPLSAFGEGRELAHLELGNLSLFVPRPVSLPRQRVDVAAGHR